MEFLKDVGLVILGFLISEISAYLKGKRDKGPKPILNVKVQTRHSGSSSPEINVRVFEYSGEITITNDSDFFAYNVELEFKSQRWSELYDEKGSIGASKFNIGSVHPRQTVRLNGKESIRVGGLDQNLPSAEQLMPDHWKCTIIGWTLQNDRGTIFGGQTKSR